MRMWIWIWIILTANLSDVLCLMYKVFLLDMHDIDGERRWFCLLVACMRDAGPVSGSSEPRFLPPSLVIASDLSLQGGDGGGWGRG